MTMRSYRNNEPMDQRALKTGEAIISLSSQAELFCFVFELEA